MEQLREAMAAWVQEFSPSSAAIAKGEGGPRIAEQELADECGPYDEDVEALGAYLAKVVTVELNMDKAASVVRWITWLVEELEEEGQKRPWRPALERLRGVVQDAVRSRGLLGDIDFG